ncbi:hypothetical protein ACLM5H_04850 [Fredinandcohnia humi]
MKNPFFLILMMISCTLSNAYFTHYSQERERKRGLISGIILTVAGLGYSTFQTMFIIRKVTKEIYKAKNT